MSIFHFFRFAFTFFPSCLPMLSQYILWFFKLEKKRKKTKRKSEKSVPCSQGVTGVVVPVRQTGGGAVAGREMSVQIPAAPRRGSPTLCCTPPPDTDRSVSQSISHSHSDNQQSVTVSQSIADVPSVTVSETETVLFSLSLPLIAMFFVLFFLHFSEKGLLESLVSL